MVRKELSRRKFLLGASALVTAGDILQPDKALSERSLPVGAIRWDAWYRPNSEVTRAVANTLSPTPYHWRAPFFAIEKGEKISFPQITQDTIDTEIQQAAYAGLDYWAFVAYSNDNPQSEALHLYFKSTVIIKPRFCMFTALEYWGSKTKESDIRELHLNYMADKYYLKVLDGRPLYFLGFITKKKVAELWGSSEALRNEIHDFRIRASAKGIAKPFIVVCCHPEETRSLGVDLGADAVGAYAISEFDKRGDYLSLAHNSEKTWNILAQSDLPVIPTVMIGWDQRPRIEHPVPWAIEQTPRVGIEYFYDQGTVEQISAHVRAALNWGGQNKSPAILIYAWNENDEGGWLIPTLPCDTRRLEALHKILQNADIASEVHCHLQK